MSIISYCYYLQAALILQVLTIIRKLGDGWRNGALILLRATSAFVLNKGILPPFGMARL